MRIAEKLLIGFMAVILLMFALAMYSVSLSEESLKNAVGRNSVFIAEDMLSRLVFGAHSQLDRLRLYFKGKELFRSALSASHGKPKARNGIEASAFGAGKELPSGPKAENSGRAGGLPDRKLSSHLRRDLIEYWEREHGYGIFSEILVTNRYGTNIAQTRDASDPYHGDETWWREAQGRGFHVGEAEYDESIGEHAISLGIAVNGEGGEFLGAVKAVIPVRAFMREAFLLATRYETTETRVISKQGRLIYSSRPFKASEDVSDGALYKRLKGEGGFFIAKEGRREKLFSYACPKGDAMWEGPNWTVVLGHDVEEVLHPAFSVRRATLQISFVLIITSILIGFLISRSITRPISKLAGSVRIIGEGDFGHIVKVGTRDEFSDFADSFNRMTANLGRSRDELQKERDFSTGIIEGTPAIICGIAPDGTTMFVNPAGEGVTGYATSDIIGRKWWGVLYPAGEYGQVERLFEELEKGDVRDHETVLTRKDGEKRTVAWSSVSRQDEKGITVETIWFGHDVTERTEAEDELRSAKKEVDQTNQQLEAAIERANEMALKAETASIAKSDFLANMSHEIRTPMNGVIGMTGLLLDSGLNPQQHQYAEIVRNSGNSLLTIVNEILDFSKIEAGRVELEILDFDLRRTLEDATDSLSLAAAEKELQLACLISHDVPALVRGDPGRLRQVLVNLAGNAIKFAHKGEVVIRAAVEEEDDTSVTVRISVSDTGIGIPRDRMELLFRSFSQIDASTTRKYGGTGLGLAISKGLAEMMGGRIGAESEFGKGSTFWFTVLLEKQPNDPRLEVIVPENIRGTRVLAADDNEISRLVLREQLVSWDCRFEEASNCEEALEKLCSGHADGDPFAVAIVDAQIAGMQGEDLGRRIREEPGLKDLKLVLLSSVGQRGDAKRAEEIGFAAYLTKPVKQLQLFDCLRRVTGTQAGGEASAAEPIVTKHTIAEDRKQSLRILVAEDNAVNQKVILAILNRLGFHGKIAANGREAVDALKEAHYDLVLMDVQMPKMDGYAATQEIRSLTQERRDESGRVSKVAHPAAGVPIVAMTANAMQGDREKCLNAGMDDYLTKPVMPKEVGAMLDKWLVGQEPQQQEGTADRDSESDRNILDREDLMERFMGDVKLADEVVGEFLAEAPQVFAGLRQALDYGDAGSVKEKAHALKGSSATVGAVALERMAGQIEAAGESGDMDKADSLISQLEEQYGMLKTALRE